jgi:O-antigen/teichoic acid export membrane protein
MHSYFSRFKFDLLIAFGLLCLPLILFWPVALGNRTLLPADNLFAFQPWQSAAAQFGASIPHNQLLSDLVLENYPWKKFIIESLRARQLPLWNPYLFAGEPFLAAGQHSALYPFSIIFYLLPLARAYGLFTVSQFFLAGLWTYLFLRVLGLRRLGATFGAIVYELSLFMVVSVVFPMIIAGAVWLPLILTAIELIAQQHPALGGRPATIPWLVLGAAALGVQILAGHVEITYYTLLISGAYSLWRLIVLWRTAHAQRERSEAQSKEPPRAIEGFRLILRRSSALLALAICGLGLGAIQLVPLYELVRNNFRSGSASFEQIIGWAYPWRHALLYLIPNFYGNPSHHGYFDLFTGHWTPATLNALGQSINTIDWGIKNYVEGGTYLGLLPLLLIPLVALQWIKLAVSEQTKDEGRRTKFSNFRPSSFVLRLSSILRPPSSVLGPSSFVFITPFFFLLALASLAFAFPTRLYALIFWLPGINQLHSPFRWVWPLAFSAAVLSAYGIEYLQRTHLTENQSTPSRAQRHRATVLPPSSVSRSGPSSFFRPSSFVLRLFFLDSSPSTTTFLASLAVWSGTLVILGLIAARVAYDRIAPLMDRLVNELALANQAFADGRMFFSYEARWIFIFALMLIASGIVLRVSRCPIYVRGRAIWQPLALGILALDLLVAGAGFNPAANPAILTCTPPSVEFLKQDTDLWRFTTYDTQGHKPFNANLGWYFDFQDIRGYDSIFPKQYRDYMEFIQPQPELDFNRIAPISDPTALNSPLLDLLNVKYVITQESIDNPKYTLVYDAEVKIYRNETVMPRAFTIPFSATVTAEDFGKAIQTFDPRQYVIVNPNVVPPADHPTPTWAAPVMETLSTPNEVFVTAAVNEASWLVLADSYFPGWKAFLRPASGSKDDEKEIAIALVDGNFRGVQIPAGNWTVRFKYSPLSVKLGGIISFTAAMLLLFALGLWLWRYFYQESAVDSTARRVAKNSLAPMALNLMNRGIDLAFAAFMLRVLGPDDAGKYYFAIVIFGWFEIITNYGLNTLLTRDVSRDREHANRYLSNTTILRLLIGLAAIPVLAGLLALRQSLPAFTLPLGLGALHPDHLTADTLWAITLLVIAQIPATISTGLSALFYAYEKAEYPAAVATISTLVKVSLGTIALVLGFGFVGLAGVSVIVNLITLMILGLLSWRLFFKPRFEFDPDFQRHALRESFPLMLNNLLATLFFKVDVTLLEPIRGTREVGWYSTAYKFLDAYNIVPSLFTFALFPVMSRQARDPEGKAALQRSYALAIKLMVAIALPLASVTAFLAPIMISLLGGQEYLPGALALAIMVWSIPFGWINSVTNYLLIALDLQRGLTRAFAISLAFNVIANLIFLPRYGYPAAAAITIASEIFEGAAFYWYLRQGLGHVPWLRLLWRLGISAAAMTSVTAILWPVQPLLALLAGLGIYSAGIIFLGAFTPEEQAILAAILPARLRQKLRPVKA